MGQSIVVNEKPSSNPGVVRFETNRAITGMGHERYPAGTEVWGERPPDELARRLLARGGVANVQINANVVTVDLEKGYDATGLKAIIENLYRFYPDTPLDEVVAIASEEAAKVHDDGTADPGSVTPDLDGVPAVAAPVGDDRVESAPSVEAAAAPEQAAVPADGTPAVADDAPAPEHVDHDETTTETAPTDDPGPEPVAAVEPEAPSGTEADAVVAAAPESDPEAATAPEPTEGEAPAGTEADAVVAAAPESDPEAATAPEADPA